MLLIVIDAHSKWIEAHPLSTITSSTTSRCFRKIFASFGVPESLVTDNGPSFVSEEFEQFLSKNAIKHKLLLHTILQAMDWLREQYNL